MSMILPVALILLAGAAAAAPAEAKAPPKRLPSSTTKRKPKAKAKPKRRKKVRRRKSTKPVARRDAKRKPTRRTRRATTKDKKAATTFGKALKKAINWNQLGEKIKQAKGAADLLRRYLRAGGNFGSRARPSAEVKKAQKLMGMPKSEQDGIVGKKTRAKAKQWGAILPSRGATPKPTKGAGALKLPTTKLKAAASKQADRKATAEMVPRQHAIALKNYLLAGGNMGTKNNRSAEVAKAQRGMKGGLSDDGILGNKTRARAAALGVTIPSRTTLAAMRRRS